MITRCSLKHVAGALPALTLLLTSCTADKIELPDKELYTREFIKQFGTFSSGAGWNSATRVTADINPAVAAGGESINVYTAWPTNPDSRIVASFPAGTTRFEFDYPDGLEYAYVQVLDADGRPLYGAYSRITDRQLSVGHAGQASRADSDVSYKPTLYAYNLNNNGALGTFLIDQDYNKDFWKRVLGDKWTATSKITKSEPVLWKGNQSSGNWSSPLRFWGSKDKLTSLNSENVQIKVTGSVNDPSQDAKYLLMYSTGDGEWDICLDDDPFMVEQFANNEGENKSTFELEYVFTGDKLATLKEHDLVLKGTNVTWTKVTYIDPDNPQYDNSGSIDIDTETVHDVTTDGSYPFDLDWGGKPLYGFGDAVSNRIQLTVRYQVACDAGGQHMFVLKEGNDKDIIGSGNLDTSLFEPGKTYEWTTYINPDKLSLLRQGAKISGENVTIAGITYKELPYLYETQGGTYNFKDLFNLYGLTTAQVSDLSGYLNSALAPYNEYDREGYTARDLVSIIGPKTGVFHEEVNKSTGNCNLKDHYSKLRPDEGVDYWMKEDGEVSLNYFFGCASTFNSLGYFYYTDEEAQLINSNEQLFVETLLKKPKFILIYRAFPHTNILIKKPGDTDWSTPTNLADLMNSGGVVESGDDEGKDRSDEWQHCGEFVSLVDKAEAGEYADGNYPRFRSANYRLVYYSPDQFNADGQIKEGAIGSYIFPKDTHIAFFIINGGQYALQKNGSAGYKIDQTRISFSRPLLNKYLGNVFNASGHSHNPATNPSTNIANNPVANADNSTPTYSDPWTPFVTYSWGGDIIMGVEDYFAETRNGINGSDHDMNDMLFHVHGDFVRNREELNPEQPKSQSWIIACEDLGGTHDFDFNDVVFGVTHVAGQDKATVTALASGGTLPVYLESIYPQTSGSSSSVTREDGKTYYTLTPEESNGGEFHSWWGGDRPHSSIINATGWSGRGKEIQIQVDDSFTLSDVDKTRPGTVGNGATNMGGFRVRVHRNGTEYTTISAPTQAAGDAGYEAPQMFLVPHTWNWPVESQLILDVYPDFNKWDEGTDWWTHPDGPAGSNFIKHNWVPTAPVTDK